MLHVVRTTVLLLLLVQVAQAVGPDPAGLDDARLVQLLTEGVDGQPLKCGTPYSAELKARGLALPSLAAAEGDTLEYLTAEGHFRVIYNTEGLAPVDPTDEDNSGVPDYVEMVGRAFERSWSVEVDSLGFGGPDIGDERYLVSLFYRTTAFGETRFGDYPGGSYILIRYSMEPFCTGEDDPDTCELKALQATIAHEFKHAIQFAEGWSLFAFHGVYWIELDATWVEDLVFDDSNDYYRYLDLFTTPFTAPTTSLAQAASYQSCTWDHYLGEYYSQDFMNDYSDALLARGFPQYGQLAYKDVADARGIDWLELWQGYTGATYLCGERAAPGMGFDEADEYPTAVTVPIASLPQAEIFTNLSDMAMRFYQLEITSETSTRRLDILFEEVSGVGHFTLLAVFQRADKTVVVPVPIIDGHADFRPNPLLADYDTVGVLVGNSRVPATSPSAASYRLTLGATEVPTRPSSMGGFKGRFRQRAGD